MLEKNKVSELLHICSVQLISKIENTEYIGAEKLMDRIEQLQQIECEMDIKFAYTADEKEALKMTCDKIASIVGEMRDWIVEFLKNNI